MTNIVTGLYPIGSSDIVQISFKKIENCEPKKNGWNQSDWNSKFVSKKTKQKKKELYPNSFGAFGA